jgi:hypothetical protein
MGFFMKARGHIGCNPLQPNKEESDMAKQKKIARLLAPPPENARGRTAKTRQTTPDDPLIANKAAVKLEKRTEANRPTGKSSTRGGKNRGDRRDMSPTYTGNAKHAARGNTPRQDVKTRKR